MNWFRLIKIIASERWSSPTLNTRAPESELVMSSSNQVSAFDREGLPGGVLDPIYEYVCHALSALLPPNGRMVDIGCGSGRLIIRLASLRPDIEVIGIDASAEMIATAKRSSAKPGLDRRLKFVVADLSEAEQIAAGRVDLVAATFLIHHLRDFQTLVSFLTHLRGILDRSNANLWLFDFIRPRTVRYAEELPRVVTPHASSQFLSDTTHSLIAAFSMKEVAEALRKAGLTPNHVAARGLRLYQAAWMDHGNTINPRRQAKVTDQLSSTARLIANALPEVPLA